MLFGTAFILYYTNDKVYVKVGDTRCKERMYPKSTIV